MAQCHLSEVNPELLVARKTKYFTGEEGEKQQQNECSISGASEAAEDICTEIESTAWAGVATVEAPRSQ